MSMAEAYRLQRVFPTVEQATRVLASAAVLVIICIAFLTLLDVGLRAVFSTTIRGLNEILILVLGVSIAACIPSGCARAVHLAVDMLTAALPAAAARALRLSATLLLMLFLALAGGELFRTAATYDVRNQASIILGVQVAPFYYAMAGLLLLCVPVQALHVIDAAAEIFRGRLAAVRLLELVPALAVLAVAALIWADAAVLLPGISALKNMQAGVAALVFFGLMWVLMLLAVPLAAAMGLVGFFGVAVLVGVGPAGTVIGSETAKFLTSETLAVLPMFLLMGSFASVAGLSSDIYRFAYELLKPLRGSLAHATIAGCAGFGALTGSSLATAATFGKVALPEMQARSYSPVLAAGSVAAGGTLGSLVPPSTALILFALLSEQSIGQLFMAAIGPAILAITLYLLCIALWLRLRPEIAPAGTPIYPRALLAAARSCIGAIVLFGTVIGGIYTGIFTDAEAASIGAVGAFMFAFFRGRLAGGNLWRVLAETTTTVALIYTLIFGAVTFSFLIAFTQVPALLSGWILDLGVGPLTVILLLVLVYLVLGMVMDSYAMMVITVPIFLPLIIQMGYDPIWWGVVTVVCVEMGMITPPFGMNIFMLNSISKEMRLPVIYRGVMPFVLADLLKLAILIALPSLALWLPSQM